MSEPRIPADLALAAVTEAMQGRLVDSHDEGTGRHLRRLRHQQYITLAGLDRLLVGLGRPDLFREVVDKVEAR